MMYTPLPVQAIPLAGGGLGLAPATRSWPTRPTECCGGPSGSSTCMYATLCAPCAAGDVAAAAGRSYACSCCITPFFCVIALPCVRALDRTALAARLAVHDDFGCAGACLATALGCGLCLLCQEVAALKISGFYAQRGLLAGSPATLPAGGRPGLAHGGPSVVIVQQQQRYVPEPSFSADKLASYNSNAAYL